MHVCSASQSCQTLQRHGLEPTRFLCPWNFPGKNTGVGLPFPSPRNLPDPGIEPASPTLAGFFTTEPPRKPGLDPGRMETMTEEKSRAANPKPHPSMQMFSIQKQVFSPTLPHVRVYHPAGSELRRQGGMLFIVPKASRKHSVKTW